MDADRELLQLEQQMRQPDCIMEPDILQVLRKYVQRGGKPDTAVELLADSYVGYAQMAQLTCQWLALATGEAPPEAVYSPEAGNNLLVAMLEEMAFEKFDPRVFKGIFKKGGSGPPPWLEGIVNDAYGRQLVYDLSSRHRTCLLLNFAIQRILSLGFAREVAGVGGPLTGFFDVFSRIFAARLEAAALSGDPLGTEAAIEMATKADEHTYLYALMVLTKLGDMPLGGPFRAVASAIQRAVGDSQGPGVWQEASQLSPALLPRHIGKVDRAAHKAAAMLLQSRADPSGPLQRLMSLYFPSTASADPDTGSLQAAPTPRGRGGRGSRGSTPRQGRRADDRERAWDAVAADEAPSTSHSDGGQPLPSISAIQRLPVLQHLMALLFNPARQLPLQDQQRARRILALACSADTEHAAVAARATPGGWAANGNEGTHGQGLPTRGRGAGPHEGAGDPGGEGGELTFRMTLEEAETVLDKAAQVGRAAISGVLPHDHDLGVATILPAACTGMLHQMMWHVDEVGEQFLTPATTRAMCKAGQHIYGAQPQLCAHVLALFRDVCLSPGTESGTRLAMVELVLEVLTRHNSGLALEWLSAFARRAAPDDAQFALYGVLSQCGPPYSATYAAAVLELMAAAQVRGPQDCPEGSSWWMLLMEVAHGLSPEILQQDAVRAALGHERVEAYLDALWVLRKGAKVDAAPGL